MAIKKFATISLALLAAALLFGCKSGDEASTNAPEAAASTTPPAGSKAAAAGAQGMKESDLSIPSGSSTTFGSKSGG